ncbi:hypothetical protein [Candidatus Frankia nodulisporulans]|uniref:hypothetical protein n=1 Tax=Candidatus Frankia nodulisporulans TaxID=2060052 RepID=UPI0013D72DD0|nr:hypothetical protein [Candidatus Frankia nodulisporulans]
MSLRSRLTGAPSTPVTLYGVHCAACTLGPAAYTASKAEAKSWAATHNRMRHRGADTAQVKNS